MNPFTTVQRKKALVWLSLFHLLVITSSNYLVQLPISIFGFHTTGGVQFSFIFLATDLTVRIFGAAGATHHLRSDGPGADYFLWHFGAVLYGRVAGLCRAGHL